MGKWGGGAACSSNSNYIYLPSVCTRTAAGDPLSRFVLLCVDFKPVEHIVAKPDCDHCCAICTQSPCRDDGLRQCLCPWVM